MEYGNVVKYGNHNACPCQSIVKFSTKTIFKCQNTKLNENCIETLQSKGNVVWHASNIICSCYCTVKF
jgi:hypothetical protein